LILSIVVVRRGLAETVISVIFILV